MADTTTLTPGATGAPGGLYDVETEVRDRYRRAARETEQGLCCASTDFDPAYLAALPAEIIEKDYGCGDPTRYVREGETVLDLGSGAGKACYIAAQRVGPRGRVIGVDMSDEMLSITRKYQRPIADRLGYANTRFVKARIQDLALDLEKLEEWLRRNPVRCPEDIVTMEAECERLRRESPLIADESVDLVVSNCVLNLVRPDQKKQLFREIFRVLKRGGGAVISDITCDEEPTLRIKADPALWSGCIAGAFREPEFLEMFEDAGFYGIEILARAEKPWQVIDGIEFRSMTVRAFKGRQGPCLERNQAVIYRGPWKSVCDDDDHTYRRGLRTAVCDKTFRLLTDPTGPYAGQFEKVEPREEIPVEAAKPFDCRQPAWRDPRQTKGQDYRETRSAAGGPCDCGPDCC